MAACWTGGWTPISTILTQEARKRGRTRSGNGQDCDLRLSLEPRVSAGLAAQLDGATDLLKVLKKRALTWTHACGGAHGCALALARQRCLGPVQCRPALAGV